MLRISKTQTINSVPVTAGNINYKILFSNFLLWVLLGVGLGVVAIPIIALHFLYLVNKKYLVEIFIGFFFVLILSDSRLPGLRFAKDLKVFLMLLLLVPLFYRRAIKLKINTSASLHQPFLPYIIFAFFCIIFSPVPFTAFQKTLSYLLLLIVSPIMFYSLFQAYKLFFLKAVIYLGVAVLIAGYVMYFINPSLAMYFDGGRASGALGNPNGLGMFCFVFYLLYFTVRHYFPIIFNKKENIFIHVLIFSSLLWSGSRGQTISVIIFYVMQLLSKRNQVAGLLISGAIGVLLINVNIDIVSIAQALGFEDYLRVDTLEKAGGRVIAREFAWEQIQYNYWVGKGFSYTEYIFAQNFWELSMRGHEGNAHNAFLTVWLDTGLIGLILFILGWGVLFLKAAKNSYLAFPIAFAVITSNMVESWLVASLNPFTIQVVMILTILIFIVKDQQENIIQNNVNVRSI